MSLSQTLKIRQRKEREGYHPHLVLRIHRAISWLKRSEECEDSDGQFVFLWIAFNSAYSRDFGDYSLAEFKQHQAFFAELVRLDEEHPTAPKRLYDWAWQNYPKAIRGLIDSHYTFQPFWDHHNGLASGEHWEDKFASANRAAQNALAKNDTATILSIVFSRLYTLRNQMIHGGATCASKVNRAQLRMGVAIVRDVLAIILPLMMDNPQKDWGQACYPVVE